MEEAKQKEHGKPMGKKANIDGKSKEKCLVYGQKGLLKRDCSNY